VASSKPWAKFLRLRSTGLACHAHREKEHGAVLSEEAAAATKALRATQGRLRYIT
jgi:hypothetical protein